MFQRKRIQISVVKHLHSNIEGNHWGPKVLKYMVSEWPEMEMIELERKFWELHCEMANYTLTENDLVVETADNPWGAWPKLKDNGWQAWVASKYTEIMNKSPQLISRCCLLLPCILKNAYNDHQSVYHIKLELLAQSRRKTYLWHTLYVKKLLFLHSLHRSFLQYS